MAEVHRLYSSSDVPEFASYPASPDEAMGRNRGLEGGGPTAALDLEWAARRIGAALGRAVVTLRDSQERVQDRVGDAAYELRYKIRATKENYSRQAQEKLEMAQEKLDEVRGRARQIAKQAKHDYPVQCILCGAVAGLLLGAGLRVWRGNRD